MNIIFIIACIFFIIGVPVLTLILVAALVKPDNFNKRFQKKYTRRKIVKLGLTSILATLIISFTAMGLTAPPSVNTSGVPPQKEVKSLESQKLAPKTLIKTEIRTENIPFTTTEQKDSSLPNGERKTTVAGIDGVRTRTYEVTYINDIEQSRKELKSEITAEPVSQIVKVGTQIENTQKNEVNSGATAKCNDGSLSYSANHRGTCSHHGGVSEWYK